VNTLLIVDHEAAIRTLVSKWVQFTGYVVAEAGSAGEALDCMAQSPATVAVLCDVSLPDRNGRWLAAQMRRQFPETALVMTNGDGLTATPATLDDDAIGYLPKPFTQQQLLEVLEWASKWRHGRNYLASATP
jgi:DNA-binding NtrC family response regulator